MLPLLRLCAEVVVMAVVDSAAMTACVIYLPCPLYTPPPPPPPPNQSTYKSDDELDVGCPTDASVLAEASADALPLQLQARKRRRKP